MKWRYKNKISFQEDEHGAGMGNYVPKETNIINEKEKVMSDALLQEITTINDKVTPNVSNSYYLIRQIIVDIMNNNSFMRELINNKKFDGSMKEFASELYNYATKNNLWTWKDSVGEPLHKSHAINELVWILNRDFEGEIIVSKILKIYRKEIRTYSRFMKSQLNTLNKFFQDGGKDNEEE